MHKFQYYVRHIEMFLDRNYCSLRKAVRNTAILVIVKEVGGGAFAMLI